VTRTLALAAGVLLAGCSPEAQETRYISLTAAELAGAVHEGLIPNWLPKNANTLKEKHDAKSSIVRFAFPESEKWSPPADCAQVARSGVRAPAITASWWPDELPSKDYIYFACAGGRAFVAINFAGGEALHWRP
jgi:hypothetical protein